MKTKLLISLILFAVLAAFIFEKKPENERGALTALPPVTKDSEFLINVMQSGIDYDYSEYPDLNANAWHIYCGPGGGWPGVSNDNVYTAPGVYGSDLLDKIDENRSHGFRSIMERPRTVHLGYAQRSEYQCETLRVGIDDYWFYAYNTHQAGIDINDYDFNGNGARVRYCQANPTNPGINAGYVVKDLRANREQANKLWTEMQRDDIFDWYVMPRIRIDTSVVRLTPNTKVCAVEILDWNGDKIDSVDILAKHFKEISSTYSGNYLEELYFLQTQGETPEAIRIDAPKICPGPAKYFWDWASTDSTNTIKTDFRVYWYGLCDMWIDYVRVENEKAHQFFDSTYDWEEDVRAEADFALHEYDENHPIPNNFYLEEFEFNMVPCIKHFNELVMDQTDNKISMMVNLNYPLFKIHIPHSDDYEFSASDMEKYLINRVNLKYLVNMSYPLQGRENGNSQSYHPNTLSNQNYSKSAGILSHKVSASAYEDSLQKILDEKNGFSGGAGFGFIQISKKTDSISKDIEDLSLIHLEQAHLIWTPTHQLKEPSNEEMKLMANLSISYGAKGIMYFAYNSDSTFDDNYYQRGLTEPITLLPRISSVYGQNKWNAIKEINSTLKKWGPNIVSFDTHRHSYIYRLERDNMISETFVNDVISYTPDPEDYTSPSSSAEQTSSRYLQVAIFNNPGELNTRYFMLVNRRCSPFDSTDPQGENGVRFIKTTLDSNHADFSGFNNWCIFDLEKDSLITTFDKGIITTINLGRFMPGEGKLYKIAPVMQEGGTLVADEECSGEFDCKGEVNNNGKNIKIKPGTTINFANTNARITMTGGTFKSGLTEGENTAPVYLKGKDDNFWKGISLNECDTVSLLRTYFRNISPYPADSTYAVDLIDCKFIKIESGNFLSELDIKSGCIRSSYVTNEDAEFSAYIKDNTFEIDDGGIPAVSFISTAGRTFPMIIDGNIFTAYTSNNSSNAILISNITGGVIKNNDLTNYRNGIVMLSSSIDLYHNTITCDSIGVQVISGTANLGSSGEYQTGGFNNISSDNDDGINVRATAGYFTIGGGYNTFNVNSSSAYHLAGTFATSIGFEDYAGYNCFKLNSTNSDPQVSVGCSSGFNCYILFEFEPIYCSVMETEDYHVFNIGEGIYDTVYITGGGYGGGMSNEKVKIENAKLEKLETTPLNELYSSICIETRKRNYALVYDLCEEVLNNYADSIQSLDASSKLFLAALVLDSNGNKVSGLKTFYETLILENGENESLVKKLFYLIQKSKVSLEQYQSALTGFQQIINENPYNYDGLLASWDYAATSLLVSGQGGSGGEISNDKFQISNDELQITNEDLNNESRDKQSQIENPKFQILNDDPNEKYDKKVFTKEDRKTIRQNVFQSFETSRDKEVNNVKELEKKVEEGKANENEKSELQKKRVLSEMVKAKKPNDINEQIKIMNSNIQNLFGVTTNISQNKNENTIPTEFHLSQNYPNPFNPVTKIKFDLPFDSKVKLIVYDLLGREIKTIVNSQLSQGRYEYDFTGSNFASGVYFYRIEAVQNSGEKFIETKRMVLLK